MHTDSIVTLSIRHNTCRCTSEIAVHKALQQMHLPVHPLKSGGGFQWDEECDHGILNLE